jgi:hypothetical protein
MIGEVEVVLRRLIARAGQDPDLLGVSCPGQRGSRIAAASWALDVTTRAANDQMEAMRTPERQLLAFSTSRIRDATVASCLGRLA